MDQLGPAVEACYGKTVSVPITMPLALSGRLGPHGRQRVRPLPFELAALPQRRNEANWLARCKKPL